MLRLPPTSTRPHTRVPYPTVVRSLPAYRLRQQRFQGIGRLRVGVETARRLQALVGALQRRPIHVRLCQAAAVQVGLGNLQPGARRQLRAEEHTSELQSLMRISYAVFCLTKKKSTMHNCTSDI